VSVDLRGADVGVSEELLHCPQIGSAFEQVRCVRMTQGMRMQGSTII
jgi:hypothetical protein